MTCPGSGHPVRCSWACASNHCPSDFLLQPRATHSPRAPILPGSQLPCHTEQKHPIGHPQPRINDHSPLLVEPPGVPAMAQWVTYLACLCRGASSIPGLVQWVKDLLCCGVGCSCGSDFILGLELPYAARVAIIKKKKKKKLSLLSGCGLQAASPYSLARAEPAAGPLALSLSCSSQTESPSQRHPEQPDCHHHPVPWADSSFCSTLVLSAS